VIYLSTRGKPNVKLHYPGHYSRKVYTRRPRSPLSSLHPETVPGVSIIRPLKGLDPNLYENLESSFLQEYSNFEVIFSVHDKNDQALTVVDELVRKYPAVPVQVITSECYSCAAAATSPRYNRKARKLLV
jgi:cellulose synthase/poly-beta-1,6-N-acetylglucosamine synthase-like glycosyltransferase